MNLPSKSTSTVTVPCREESLAEFEKRTSSLLTPLHGLYLERLYSDGVCDEEIKRNDVFANRTTMLQLLLLTENVHKDDENIYGPNILRYFIGNIVKDRPLEAHMLAKNFYLVCSLMSSFVMSSEDSKAVEELKVIERCVKELEINELKKDALLINAPLRPLGPVKTAVSPKTTETQKTVVPPKTTETQKTAVPLKTIEVQKTAVPPKTTEAQKAVVPPKTIELSTTTVPTKTTELQKTTLHRKTIELTKIKTSDCKICKEIRDKLNLKLVEYHCKHPEGEGCAFDSSNKTQLGTKLPKTNVHLNATDDTTLNPNEKLLSIFALIIVFICLPLFSFFSRFVQ
ncbi:unnamed protein product [Bursaphelenchus okinawaensis]|uniref:Uncharacterized protein n=1 Tax=Bursaphelenchus okinawaensis TaxID=465554 RepID=A0A811KAF1_9BILA|nr:unnamed protein product [Bursaphelenchus okinawaensis]CAG9097382.1 unnamed protein product [Bursaphelenchus okinawaensis]